MASKVVVLGACCSGKSSLCEQLRIDHRSVIECDEAVMLAAGGAWPASAEENHRLVIEAASAAIAMTDVIFLTSWMPTEMLRRAHDRGFTVALLSVSRPELERRNSERLAEGGSSDVSHWFEPQLDNYTDLGALGLIDVELDGTQTTAALANRVAGLAQHCDPERPLPPGQDPSLETSYRPTSQRQLPRSTGSTTVDGDRECVADRSHPLIADAAESVHQSSPRRGWSVTRRQRRNGRTRGHPTRRPHRPGGRRTRRRSDGRARRTPERG